jgi:DNA mismatch repair protein MutS2
MYNVSEVRIIHGRGTGVLKQMALAYLKKYPYAKTYKPAIREAGGDGVTVVNLQ